MSEPRTEAGRALRRWLIEWGVFTEDSTSELDRHILAIKREAAAPQPLDVEALLAEIRANRAQGVTWEPPASPQVTRWYAEGYDRGLRDAEVILARLSRKEPSDRPERTHLGSNDEIRKGFRWSNPTKGAER